MILVTNYIATATDKGLWGIFMDNEKKRFITIVNGYWFCDCDSNIENGLPCKHIIAVVNKLDQKNLENLYFNRRWLRDSGIIEAKIANNKAAYKGQAANKAKPNYFNTNILKSSQSDNTSKFAKKSPTDKEHNNIKVKESTDKITATIKKIENKLDNKAEEDKYDVKDPDFIKTKGRPAKSHRTKSAIDKVIRRKQHMSL
jgi:hypothetical protein